MVRLLIIIIIIIIVYLFFRKKFVLKSIIETLKINRVLRYNLIRLLARLFFRRF